MQPNVVTNMPVSPAQFTPLSTEPVQINEANIGLILDVPLQVTVELGRTKKTIKEILDLATGSIVELDKLAGEPVEIQVNGHFLAKGEVVVIDHAVRRVGVELSEDVIHRAALLGQVVIQVVVLIDTGLRKYAVTGAALCAQEFAIDSAQSGDRTGRHTAPRNHVGVILTGVIEVMQSAGVRVAESRSGVQVGL